MFTSLFFAEYVLDVIPVICVTGEGLRSCRVPSHLSDFSVQKACDFKVSLISCWPYSLSKWSPILKVLTFT